MENSLKVLSKILFFYNNIMEVNGCQQLFGYQQSTKYLFFNVQQKKETHLEQLEGE